MKTFFLKSILKKSIPLSFFGFLLIFSSTLTAQDLDVPYVPTPQKVVNQMLDMVDVQPSDYVIDLGSGDGRIVIAAAKRGASGHGVDLDPERISEARKSAANEGVDNQIMFREANIFDTDFNKASVITMYLLSSVNKKLRPELLDKLEPGTEIVSHSFDMGEWEPDKQASIDVAGRTRTHNIYYWVIPAKVGGIWQWTANDKDFTMNVSQEFQKVNVHLSDGNGNTYAIEKAKLQGKRITVRATNGSKNYIFSGQVEGQHITGIMQMHNGDDKTFTSWSASAK